MFHLSSGISVTFTPGDDAPVTASPHAMAPQCPPGLVPLLGTDRLFLRRIFENSNVQDVFDASHQRIFIGIEVSERVARLVWGQLRPFHMVVLNNDKKTVLCFRRPLRCGLCCLSSCQQELTVFDNSRALMGTIQQISHPLRPIFSLSDHRNLEVLEIEGPIFINVGRGTKFNIFAGGTVVGDITRKWSGFLDKVNTKPDDFSVHFPIDLDVRIKANIMALALYINILYFEKSGVHMDYHAEYRRENQGSVFKGQHFDDEVVRKRVDRKKGYKKNYRPPFFDNSKMSWLLSRMPSCKNCLEV